MRKEGFCRAIEYGTHLIINRYDIMKKNKYELCEEGRRLFVDSVNNFTEEKYKLYVAHVTSCEECKHGLGIEYIFTDIEVDEFEEV